MDNVVIDTNSLLMALSARSGYHRIWKSFLAGDFVLCVSNEILEEYAEVIARNISVNLARYVVFTIMERNNVRQITPFYKWHLITSDPDDNKFVDYAIFHSVIRRVSEEKLTPILYIVRPSPSKDLAYCLSSICCRATSALWSIFSSKI